MLNMGQDEVQRFIKMVEPARLANTIENAAAISQYVKSHNLPHNAESCLKAVHALLFQDSALTWDVKPQKLLLMERDARPATITTALESEKLWAARVKAGEIADAKRKADVEATKAITSAINGYTPVAGGRISFGKQAEETKRLHEYVKQQLARNASPQSIFEQVEKEIARLYRVDERAMEKMR
jgi:hypothetical protein